MGLVVRTDFLNVFLKMLDTHLPYNNHLLPLWCDNIFLSSDHSSGTFNMKVVANDYFLGGQKFNQNFSCFNKLELWV